MNFKIKLLLFPLIVFYFLSNCPIDINSLPWVSSGKDGDELRWVKQFLPDEPIILEAGACGGEDTINFPKIWPKCTVHAFEPVPSFFENLKKYVGNIQNINLYPFGLFTKTGTYSFYLCQGQTPGGASSLFPSADLPESKYDERPVTIFCKNLDEWAQENNIKFIDYMWLDMEGAEYYVLSSAPRILKTVKVISCELNFREFRKGMPQFEDLYNFLINEGFILYKIWGSPTWQAIGIFMRPIDITFQI